MIIVITECFPGINIISYMLLCYYIADMMTRNSEHGWIDIMIFYPRFFLLLFNDSSDRVSGFTHVC